MLSPDQAKTYKNQTLLREFISDLKQICQVSLKIDLQGLKGPGRSKTDEKQGSNAQHEMSYNM